MDDPTGQSPLAAFVNVLSDASPRRIGISKTFRGEVCTSVPIDTTRDAAADDDGDDDVSFCLHKAPERRRALPMWKCKSKVPA